MSARLALGSIVPRAKQVALNTIRDVPGARRPRVRVGRGRSSGLGKTSGRGHKGQKQRESAGPYVGYEGGQTPFYRAIPKHGFTNRAFRVEYEPVNLGQLQQWLDRGRIDPRMPITMRTLWRSGLVTRVRHGIKLLAGVRAAHQCVRVRVRARCANAMRCAQGDDAFHTPVDIEVARASQQAIAAVERAGGKITCAYYNRIGLRALLMPEKFTVLPRRAQPTLRKVLDWYADPAHRGNLAPAAVRVAAAAAS